MPADLGSDAPGDRYVEWFNEAKGVGFVPPDDRRDDIFEHFSAIDMPGLKALQEVRKAACDIVDGDRGRLQASSIG